MRSNLRKEIGKRMKKIAKGNKWRLGKKHTEKTKKKISKTKKGTESWNKGLTKEDPRVAKTAGKNHYNWKGGVTNRLNYLRKTNNYKEWRIKVFERDNWTCQNCGIRGIYLEAHHIKQVCDYPDLIFDVENGLTLCSECHKEIDEYRKKFDTGG